VKKKGVVRIGTLNKGKEVNTQKKETRRSLGRKDVPAGLGEKQKIPLNFLYTGEGIKIEHVPVMGVKPRKGGEVVNFVSSCGTSPPAHGWEGYDLDDVESARTRQSDAPANVEREGGSDEKEVAAGKSLAWECDGDLLPRALGTSRFDYWDPAKREKMKRKEKNCCTAMVGCTFVAITSRNIFKLGLEHAFREKVMRDCNTPKKKRRWVIGEWTIVDSQDQGSFGRRNKTAGARRGNKFCTRH